MLLFAVNIIHQIKGLPRKDVINFGLGLLVLLVLISIWVLLTIK